MPIHSNTPTSYIDLPKATPPTHTKVIDILTLALILFLLTLIIIQAAETNRAVQRAYQRCNDYYNPETTTPQYNFTINFTTGAKTT